MSSAQVPEGYKKSEVGVIPDDWDDSNLANIVEIIDGDRGTNYPSDNDFSSDGYCLFLSARNVTKDGFRFSECFFITEKKDKILRKGKLSRKDIVLTTRGTVGNFAFFDNSVPYEDIRINSGMVLLRNESNGLDHYFLYLTLKSHVIQNQVERAVFGSAQPQLTVRGISKFKIPLPPLPEQRSIATTLSDVDALIASLDKLIAKQHHLKTAAMQQLLTGKMRLPGFGEGKGYKQTEIGLIPEDWDVKKLGDVLKIRHGRSQHEIVDPSGIYPILATGGEIGRTNTPLYSEPSVLIGRKGTIDTPKYMDTPFWTVDTLFYSEISKHSDPRFIFYKFNLIDWYSYNEASGVPSLNAATIERIDQTFPVLKEEQRAIATVLSNMDSAIAALETRRAKTQAIKQGMMQELLTGRTRLV